MWLLARGSRNCLPRARALCQGISCKDSGKHQGAQTFPVPEPNVSGLSCWFCHLLPWKLGVCPLLGTLASLSARWLQLCQSLTLRVFTSLVWFPPASPAVSWLPSFVPGESVITSHNLSVLPFCTFRAMSDLSSLALEAPGPQHPYTGLSSPCSVSPACVGLSPLLGVCHSPHRAWH